MSGGRPPLPLGAWGDIHVKQLGPSKYQARARFRDRTGKLRYVARVADTPGRARDALRAALADWKESAGQGLTRSTTLSVLAADWLDEMDASNLAVNTKQKYRDITDRCLTPQLGSIRISEADAGVVDAALTRIRTDSGVSAARMARAILNGMFALAARHGTVTVNPVRETRTISSPRRVARALTDTERETVVTALHTDPRAISNDLPDLVDFGLGTGCRIGEALAIRETVLDLEAGTVEINATAVRVKGLGMVIQERPKTAAGWRILALPSPVVDMLHRRRDEPRFQPPTVRVLGIDGKYRDEAFWVVFPSPFARALRDPSNTSSELRAALDRIGGLEWATFHTLRKTVATRLDDAGMPAKVIADVLGHARPSMTQDVYMGRRVVSAEAARILEGVDQRSTHAYGVHSV